MQEIQQSNSYHRYLYQNQIDAPLDKVFDFFSKPENLSEITPAKLGFNILTPSPIKMEKGTLIDYTIKLMGIPLRWRSLITDYDPPKKFVDEQLKGPYSYWHHKHTFKEVDGGILIIDEITYALPIQAFRRIVHPVLIKTQLNQIFDFIFQTIKDKFK